MFLKLVKVFCQVVNCALENNDVDVLAANYLTRLHAEEL